MSSANYQPIRSVVIAEELRGEDSRTVTLSMGQDGSLRIQASDEGPTAERLFGTPYYDIWVTVPESKIHDLAVVLLKDRFEGDLSAVNNLKSLLTKSYIEHEVGGL